MHIRWRTLTLSALVVVVLTGCRGGDTVEPLQPRIVVDGPDTVRVGQTVRFQASFIDTAGAPPSYVHTSWVALDPTRTTLNTRGIGSAVDVTGRTPGIVTLTAVRGTVTGTREIVVRDERPIVPAALGGTVSGQLVNGVSAERIALTLAAGDTIDLMANAPVVSTPLRVEWSGAPLPVGTALSWGSTGIAGAVGVPAAGTYHVSVFAGLRCSSSFCAGITGSYTLRVRRSAPIFHADVQRFWDFSLPQGGVVRDSVSLQNFGLGSFTVQASSGAPWLQPDASHATVGPVRAVPPGNLVAPAETPLAVTMNTAGLAVGRYSASVKLDAPADVWSPYATPSVSRFVRLRVYDSTARVISGPTRTQFLAATPDGRLIGAHADSVFRIDTTSGATTRLAVLSPVASRWVRGLEVGADGNVYFSAGRYYADSLFKLVPGGAEAIMGWGTAPAAGFSVLGDGTLYTFEERKLYRRVGTAAPELLADLGSGGFLRALHFSPVDSALYFHDAGNLRRYDIRRGVVETRGPISAFALVAIDHLGRLYASTLDGELNVVDNTGRVLHTLWAPSRAEDVAIIGRTIFGTDSFAGPSPNAAALWKMPVP